MVVVPGAMPVRLPEPAVIVPMEGVLLDQVPPVGVPVIVTADPWHTWIGPLMPVGDGFTRTSTERLQPPDVYTILVEPPLRPLTTPVDDTVPITGLLLLQVPPGVALLNVVVCPTHTLVPPVITAGSAFTENTAVLRQPVESVYVILAVPAVPVVIVPVLEPIAAVPGASLNHVPPAGSALSVTEVPWQVLSVEPIAPGNAFTVATAVTLQPEPNE